MKKKREGKRDVWYVIATTGMLAAGREELRKALAEIVETARDNDWVDAGKAERWLKKLEGGPTLWEGWPRYNVHLAHSGALVVRFASNDPNSVKQVARRLMDMGLEVGKHFTVKMPEGGDAGYLYIRRKGLERAAWLSVYGSEDQRKLAAKFVERILRRAEEAGKEVYEKAQKIVEEGGARGSLTLERFEKKVEVNGETYVVKVIGGEAVEEKQNGRKLLRIKITAEVDGVRSEHIVDRVVREYTITYGRYGKLSAAVGFATAKADAPGGRETDAERLAAVVEALTGKRPRVHRKKNGQIVLECGRERLDGFMRYAELADAIKRWLEETGR